MFHRHKENGSLFANYIIQTHICVKMQNKTARPETLHWNGMKRTG